MIAFNEYVKTTFNLSISKQWFKDDKAFLRKTSLLNAIYPPMKFQISISNTFLVMLQTKKICIKISKGNNSESMEMRVVSCALHFSLMRSIHLWNFKLLDETVLEKCSRQKCGTEGRQRLLPYPSPWRGDNNYCNTALFLTH